MITPIRKGFKKVIATIALLSVELLVVLIAFFCAMSLFIFLARMVFFKKKEGFDLWVFNFFSQHINNFNLIVSVFSLSV